MTAARSFVRLVFAGLFVGSLAAACVVESNGGDDDLSNTPCEDGDFRECSCPGGETGRRECNAANTGYGSCQCEGGMAGSSTGGSSTAGSSNSEAGAPTNTGGTSYGGEANTAGGVPSEAGGASGEMGGASGEVGGAGGSGGDVEPLECQDPADDCEACYFSCCDDWVACFNDETCLAQFNEVLVCIEEDEDNFVVADLTGCADSVGSAGGPWSDGLDPKTVAMINCLGGDPSSTGWADEPVWGADSCNNLCFNVE